MSGKIMGSVWDLDLPRNKQVILLAMADHADHDGNNVRPSIGLIAWKTGYSENQTRRIINDLVEDGLLILKKTPEGKPKVYSVNLEAGKKKPKYEKKKTPTIIVVPLPSNDTPTPTIQVVPEPSVEPSVLNTSADADQMAVAPEEKPKPEKPKRKARELSPLELAIKETWNTDAWGYIGKLRKQFEGRFAPGDSWHAFNIEPAALPQEVRDFGVWWRKKKDGQGKRLELPGGAQLQRRFYEWRAQQTPPAPPITIVRPEFRSTANDYLPLDSNLNWTGGQTG